MRKTKVLASVIVRFPTRAREAGEPYSRGQWAGALKAAPHSLRNLKRNIRISSAGVLICLLFLRAAGAQLIPLNFVYTGSGGQSDALKFTYAQGLFKKQGLNVTMLYVTSGVITSQTITSGSVQVATTTATDALGAMAAGSPMKIVMVNIDQFQHVFVARPEVKGPKDM
ncbi:MAG: ABC transporter substrate-binding protein, partial [Candidatus Binatia bacterium]